MKADISELITNKVGKLLGPTEIAKELEIPTADAIQFLFIAVGEGCIRESEIFFILAKKYREAAIDLPDIPRASPRYRETVRGYIDTINEDCPGADLDELVLYLSYRKRRVYVGDMYVFLTELERTLHDKIKSILMQKFGEKESGWWKAGVPNVVRINCAQAREFDGESIDHPYHFSTFIHLNKIMEKNWELFSRRLPKSVIGDKVNFLNEMVRLNNIRNQVMHPVRGMPPTEDDFEFVREMHKKIVASLWRK